MQLNKDNFLRWTGSFNEAEFDAVAVPDTVQTSTAASLSSINPLANDISTYGIDRATFEVTQEINLERPADWNFATSILTIYLPDGAVPGALVLKYKWNDLNGNESNETTITVNVAARPTGWRAYPSSFTCELDAGVRTGRSFYTTLQKYYLDNLENVVPFETKANDVGDPDYIAPVEDLVNCPINDYIAWSLRPGASASVACDGLFQPETYYTDKNNNNLTFGVSLAADSALTTPAPDGWYSNTGQAFEVLSGTIVDVVYCGTI